MEEGAVPSERDARLRIRAITCERLIHGRTVLVGGLPVYGPQRRSTRDPQPSISGARVGSRPDLSGRASPADPIAEHPGFHQSWHGGRDRRDSRRARLRAASCSSRSTACAFSYDQHGPRCGEARQGIRLASLPASAANGCLARSERGAQRTRRWTWTWIPSSQLNTYLLSALFPTWWLSFASEVVGRSANTRSATPWQIVGRGMCLRPNLNLLERLSNSRPP